MAVLCRFAEAGDLTMRGRGYRSILALAFCLAGMGSAQAQAAEERAPAVQTVIAVPAETGAWRTRSQPDYDPAAQALVRRTYTVWDPLPSRGRDFVWIPASREAEPRERVTGEGRLVWREAGKPAYDPAAFQAEYRGRMRDGRPEGQGLYRERGGLSYEGAWQSGLPHGRGTLKLPSGAEYAGQFRAGAAEGEGRFFDVDGEMFEGAFRKGLRHGRGRTLLPNGGAYLSEWVAGAEVPNSRRLRLAQLGPAAGASDDVRLGITVDRVADESMLQYTTSSSESGLLIRPGSKRLMELWKGDGNIQLTEQEENPGMRGSYGVFAYSAGDLPPLSLVFEVQNRGRTPVRLKGAYLDVASSVTDLQPAIQMTGKASGECSSRPRPNYSPEVELENFGWGPAERARIRFAFASPKTNVGPAGMTLTKQVGTVRANAKLSFEPELRAAGVRVDALKQRGEGPGIACKSKGNASACLAEIAASGLFGPLGRSLGLDERDIYVNAVGVLDYVWKDGKGVEQARSSPFTTRLLLGRTPSDAECGEGAEKEPIGRRPLVFRLDETNYRLPVAFARTIPPGRTARYTVVVKAPKSSEHKFKVVLQNVDGQQVVSRPITLTYFLPSRLTEGSPTE